MIDWGRVLEVGIAFIVFAGILAAASVYIRSGIRKEHHEEVEDLAETRGKVIQDLREKVDNLEKMVGQMQGQIDMLQKMNAQEIVDGVVVVGVPAVIAGVMDGLANDPRFKV